MANPDGTPIWFELTTDDQVTAQHFYAAVMGWSVAPSPMAEHGGYLLADAPDGAGVGGIMKPPPGMAGVPGWVIYFGVGDVDAQAQAVKAAGGAVHFGPIDIPGVGRFATCADPQGVIFNIMTGDRPAESAAFKPMAGAAGIGHGVWIELATPDPDAALGFYGQLFGWAKQGAMPMGDMGDYTFFGASETSRPGAMMSSATTGAPARWNWYVQVPDIDVAIAAAKDGGGTLIQGPDQIPGGDYSANLTDPHGQQVGVVGPRR